MNRALFFLRCYFILIGIAVLSIPFTSVLYFFITPLLLIFWIIEGDWKNKWRRMKESQTVIITCSLILFWLINVTGLFYSNDLVRGLMRTYDKLPFLVYPLVFFTLDTTCLTKTKLYSLFKGFLCATAIMLLICWGNAFTQFFKTGNTSFFYYALFSHFFGHTSYCALIVCIALCIAFHLYINSKKTYRWLWIILLLFFVVSIYFFQSRSGILALVFILIISLFYYLHAYKKSYWYGIGGIVIILLFTFTLTKLFPSRVGYYVKKVTIEQLQPEKMLGLRNSIWQITCKLAMENKMLGIGTGYHNESFLTEAEAQIINKHTSFINAHNQYLQTFLEHGLVGLIILIVAILYSLYYAIKTKNYLLLMLLITICINMFFESMLERNKGIFAFTLFFCLFVVKNIFLQPFVKNNHQLLEKFQ